MNIFKVFGIHKVNDEEFKYNSYGEQIGGPVDAPNPQWDASAKADADHSSAMTVGWTGVAPNEDEFHPETGAYSGASNSAHHVAEWAKELQEKHGVSLINDLNEPTQNIYDHTGVDLENEEKINHTHITDYIKAKTGKTETFPGAVEGEQFDTGIPDDLDDPFEFSLADWAEGEEPLEPIGNEDRRKQAFYRELLRRQRVGEGPREGYTTEQRLPKEPWYPMYRKVKFPDPDDPGEYLLDEQGEDRFKLVPTFIQNASTVDKMLWKAFGIQKSLLGSTEVTLHSGGNARTADSGEDSESIQFRTQRKAMAHAIEHVKQHPDNLATIQHNPPNPTAKGKTYGGANRLHHIPGGAAGEPMQLALTHMSHGNELNEGVNALAKKIGDGWIDHPDMKAAWAERDVMALDRMKSLHQFSVPSLGDTQMHIDTSALNDLPRRLQTRAPWGDMAYGRRNPLEKMLWKMFGIKKEDVEAILPFGCSPEQYETMWTHFKDVLVHRDNTFFTHDDDGNILESLPNSEGLYDVIETPEDAVHNPNIREAWKHFMGAVGPWYARGLTGRVHKLPHEKASSSSNALGQKHLHYETNPERYIRQSDYSAPNQWHSREDFEQGIPGQEHPRNFGHVLDDGVSDKHGRVHNNHWFGSQRYWGPYNKHWFEHGEDNTGIYSGHKVTVDNGEEGYHPDIYAKYGGETAQALPFLHQDILDQHHRENMQRIVHGPDPLKWEDHVYNEWAGEATTGFHHPLDYKNKYWKNLAITPERLQSPPPDRQLPEDYFPPEMNKMLWKMFGIHKAKEEEWNSHGEPFPTFNSAPDSQGNERAFEANNFGRYQSPRISRAIHRNDRGLDTDHLLLERTRATDPDNLRFGNRPAQYPHEWKLKALSEHYNNLLIANRGRLPLDLHQSIHAQAVKASDPDMNIAWHSTSDDTHPLEPMDYTTFSKDHLRHATYPQDEGLLYPYGPNYKNPANPNPSSSVSQVGNRYLMENVAALRYPVEDIVQTPEWKSDFKGVIDNYKLSDTLFSEGQPPAPPDLIHYKPPTKYGNIPSGGPPIKATWGEPQDVHEMQREHRRKRGETLE